MLRERWCDVIVWRRLSIITEGQGELDITIDSDGIRFRITEQNMAQAELRVSHVDLEDALVSLGFRTVRI